MRRGRNGGGSLRFANVAMTAFSSSDLYTPKGTKALAVQGYDADNPTFAFAWTVEIWDPSGAAVVSHKHTFSGVRNGTWVNIAPISPAITSVGATPTVAGHIACLAKPIGGSELRIKYVAEDV